jgi:hypothetical protein
MFGRIKSGFKSCCTFVKKHVGKALTILGAGTATVVQSVPARADLLTETQTAISSAAADALTVGGYVVAGVASLIVIGLIIALVHKVK